ncbi:hypothetical protein [Caulobacter sp. SSI4214]|uniref:hypothetical protein n=1 Tax=Caulobacter sp. SSI4214 TaxID=2575739 RepID=UPI00143AB77B|nr:hypothetical protein [Caulobacter sp. SSI4214]
MFEEIAVWARAGEGVAFRYVGFRDLKTAAVWIAFANCVGDEEQVGSDELIAPQAMLEHFLNELPTQPDDWKSTIAEAITHFIEKNPNF